MSASSTESTLSGAPVEKVSESVKERSSSYGQILKSSALIGGSSVFGFAISAVRTKVTALLLGPAGFGLTGLFFSLLELGRCLASMGVTTSGVRQIAAAVGTGDSVRIARTVLVVRRSALVLGILAALVTALAARLIAEFTFKGAEGGATRFTFDVALLGLAVMLYTVAGGQDAIIQGTRRITKMAWISVVISVANVALSVPIIYWLRERGIVPAIVAVAAFSCAMSWWYGRQVRVEPLKLKMGEVTQEATALFQLGIAFLASGLLTMGASYAVRTIVARMVDLEAAGFYHAAWALGGMYVGIVLQAMGADFYPRLTGVAEDHEECNRLVNEQAQVSLLLAAPGVIATLTLAPLVIAFFYSSHFGAAVEPLRWICLGMAMRIVAWPMGFIIVAKGRQVMFFAVEVLATAVHVGLAFLLVPRFGVNGAGMAFAGLYVVHCGVVYFLVNRLTGFTWHGVNLRVAAGVFVLLLAVFAAVHFLPVWMGTTAGLVGAVVSGIYAVRRLASLVAFERIPGPVRRLLVALSLVTPPASTK
jgi:antigen flippase